MKRKMNVHVHTSILELIGNTPMVKLRKITHGLDVNILVKLEYLNPTGSLKDRIALEMIEQAEKTGDLKPGYTIVDASTGNTGIALSFVGTLKGYKVVIYQAACEGASTERTKMMENMGATVHLIALDDSNMSEKSVAGAEVELSARQICLDLEQRHPDVWWARQFSNPANVTAHWKTGREILEQTRGKVDCFTASIGTGGTLMGSAEVLKKEVSDVKIVGIQPASSSEVMVPGESYPSSDIKGGIVSDMLKKKGLIDEIVTCHDKEAVEMTHRLWKKEGLYAGISSGANVCAALRQAETLDPGETVVTVLPDSMNRYLTEERYIT